MTSDWQCVKCRKTFSPLKVIYTLACVTEVFQVSSVTTAIKEALKKLEPNLEHPELCDIPAHEAFIAKFGQILHPQHVHLTKAKYLYPPPLCTGVLPRYLVARMYGRMPGWQADILSLQHLHRKQNLCQEVTTEHRGSGIKCDQ